MLSVHRHLSRVAASRLFDVMHETYMLTSRVVVGGNGGGGGGGETVKVVMQDLGKLCALQSNKKYNTKLSKDRNSPLGQYSA